MFNKIKNFDAKANAAKVTDKVNAAKYKAEVIAEQAVLKGILITAGSALLAADKTIGAFEFVSDEARSFGVEFKNRTVNEVHNRKIAKKLGL